MMKHAKSFVFIFFVSLILSLFRPDLCFAQTYFFDDFSDPSLSNWEFVSGNIGSSSWYVSDSVLNGKVDTGQYSYIYPTLGGTELSDYTVEADIMSISGVDHTFFVRLSPDRRKYFQIGFRFDDPAWYWDNNNITLYKVDGSRYDFLATYPSVNYPRKSNLTQNIWHKVKIVLQGTNISIYFDGNQVINYVYRGSGYLSGGVGLLNWGGDYWGTNYRKVDNFKIRANVDHQNKVIVLPGLGASWNERAMVLNQTVVPSEWKMTPFVHNYDDLVGALKQNGLTEKSDYYVWNYDWRKPLTEIVADFNTFVSGLGVSGGDQVDLVGHSLGGLVARIWTQENPDKVNKVITLGSPHAGAVKAYEAWNGASVSDKFDIQSIALNVLLQLQKKNNQSLVETVRNYAKILKDLLPTFDYLKTNGRIISPPANTYLSNKNTTAANIFSKLTAVIGQGQATKEWINLGERSVFDKILGLWEQGKPVSYQNGEGDGTVLKKSAKFEGDVYVAETSDHGSMPDKSVNLILSELGLGKTIVELAETVKPMAVFYLGSPAKMTVECNGGVGVTDVDGWVTVADKQISDCQVKLSGVGDGTYHLVTGNSDDDLSWQYSEGQIGVGETATISVVDKDFWYGQVLRKTNELLGQFGGNKNLLKIKSAAEASNIDQLMDAYLAFRKEKRETRITWSIVDDLEKILEIDRPNVNPSELEKARLNALSYKSVADKSALLLQRRRINPTVWQSLNYNQAETLLTDPSYARYILAGKIFGIVWN